MCMCTCVCTCICACECTCAYAACAHTPCACRACLGELGLAQEVGEDAQVRAATHPRGKVHRQHGARHRTAFGRRAALATLSRRCAAVGRRAARGLADRHGGASHRERARKFELSPEAACVGAVRAARRRRPGRAAVACAWHVRGMCVACTCTCAHAHAHAHAHVHAHAHAPAVVREYRAECRRVDLEQSARLIVEPLRRADAAVRATTARAATACAARAALR